MEPTAISSTDAFVLSAWGLICRRRGELIFFKNHRGLSPEEQAELAKLELVVDTIMQPPILVTVQEPIPCPTLRS